MQKYVDDARSFFLDAAMALAVNGITGDYVEFGSWGGKSFKLAHEALVLSTGASRHLWAFDSFAGLPAASDPRDVHPQWGSGGGRGVGLSAERHRRRPRRASRPSGGSATRSGIPRDAYTAVEGYFDDTLLPARRGRPAGRHRPRLHRLQHLLEHASRCSNSWRPGSSTG